MLKNITKKIIANKTLSLISLVLAINSYFFLWFKTDFKYVQTDIEASFLISALNYPIYLIIGIYIFWKSFHLFQKIGWEKMLVKLLFITLPIEIIFLWKFTQIDPHYTPLNFIFHFASTLWIYLLAFLILYKLHTYLKINLNFFQKTTSCKKWIKKQGSFYLGIIGLTMIIAFGFGSYNIQKAALVDEALWTYDRIPSFWENIKERDWYSTRVSDKPGVTTAAISGIGLLGVPEPGKYEDKKIANEKNERINFAFRFPIILFFTLMLPVLYFFIERLLGKKTAAFSIIGIGLSPILIGMTRMINPDAVLWIFTTLSMLTFLIFLEKKKDSHLAWAGFFLGLSLLTKYVANFLYVFFLGLIFLKYILDKDNEKNANLFLKKNIFSYIVLVFISLSTFFLLYPATWLKPDRILLGTIESQAFHSIFPIFLALIIFIIIDTYFWKNIILKNILNPLSKIKNKIIWIVSGIFIFFLVTIFYNAYSQASLFNFVEILSSPKSSYMFSSALEFTSANFYPLIFGISPLTLFFIIYFLTKTVSKKIHNKFEIKISIYFIIFILLYYAASLFSNVAASIRYQIILYPLVFILAGVWMNYFIKKKKLKKYTPVLIGLVIILFSLNLWRIKPFYFSYASSLLPQSYHIDYKDMGLGSYEAAVYLNSLPNAKDINIWSDKSGVCDFFIGKCSAKNEKKEFKSDKFDYYVISSGRENLISRKINYYLTHGDPDVKRIDLLYFRDDATKKIILAGRHNNFIKIFKKDNLWKK